MGELWLQYESKTVDLNAWQYLPCQLIFQCICTLIRSLYDDSSIHRGSRRCWVTEIVPEDILGKSIIIINNDRNNDEQQKISRSFWL